jgi:SAM-dependent methyltransferase
VSERRGAVPFDPEYFARLASQGKHLDRTEIFRQIWRSNHWGGSESLSGPGSGEDQTAAIRASLPDLFRRLSVGSLLDVPCGDWRWMSKVPLGGIDYTGGDLLPEVVDANQARFGGPGRRFVQLDLVHSPLPDADLLLCRDCLVHLSYADIRAALANLTRSHISWLLTTTFPGEAVNADIVTGDWRPLNLEAPPFSLPPPAELLNEQCTEGQGVFSDKSLGLWRIDDLR